MKWHLRNGPKKFQPPTGVASMRGARIVLCCTLLAAVCACAHAKPTTLEGGWSGDRQCPCFCSERDSDDFAPYWNANFGFDYVDGTACATPCRTDTTLLSNCAEHVDYRYCGRRMNNTVPATTDAGALADDIIASLDAHVLGCTSDLTWDEQDGDCMNTIRRAACYFAFPKCDANDEALDVCRSVCENERIACREMNSNWGTVQTMGCGAFEDEVGPSDLCTGGAVATAPWASLVLVVAAVVAVIELQTAGMVASHVA